MSTPADVHRSTPGYVYGVAMHSSGERKEVEPPCSCPCHVALSPRGATGWYCDKCHSFGCFAYWPEVEEVPYSHEQAIADGLANPQPYMVTVPDFYYITKGNSLDDAFPRRHFKTADAAEKAAKKRNDADVVASLGLTARAIIRRERLKNLGETFWVRYGEGPMEARWHSEPGRYAVESYSERYGESFWDTVESLDEIERDADRVYDLDEDREIPFSVNLSFGETA